MSSLPATPSAPPTPRALLRQYHDEHRRSLDDTLAARGVPAADRPDLLQEIFLAAYRALVRSDVPIDKPRAWLRLFAVRFAAKYHRDRSLVERAAIDVEELATLMNDPEQSAGERRLLAELLDEIDELAQCIVIAHKGEGLPLAEVARDHGLGEGRTEYIYRKAIADMEAALRRRKLSEGRHSGILLPITLGRLFEEARVGAGDGHGPHALRQGWEAIERGMDAIDRRLARVDGEASSRPDNRATPTIIHLRPSPTAPSALARSIPFGLCWLAGAGCGFLLCLLLVRDRALPPPPPPAPVVVEATPLPVTLPASALPVAVAEPTVPGTSTASAPAPLARSPKAAPARREPPYAKIGQARAALAAGDAPAALGALEAYGRPAKDDAFAEEWHHLLAIACRSDEVSRARACAGR
jgi:RNA polymerase sigma factor (sigma-70 family)